MYFYFYFEYVTGVLCCGKMSMEQRAFKDGNTFRNVLSSLAWREIVEMRRLQESKFAENDFS